MNEKQVVVLIKDSEKYIFIFTFDHYAEVLRTFGRYAGNTELNFTWYDAAVLSQHVRQAYYKHNKQC
jgi:hypothetical protein